MPLFDFKCKKCNTVEEHVVFSSEEANNILCPNCKIIMDKQVPKQFSFNFANETGVWEKGEDGQEHYKGRGGRQTPMSKTGRPLSE